MNLLAETAMVLDGLLLPSPLWSPLLVVVAWPTATVLAEREILANCEECLGCTATESYIQSELWKSYHYCCWGPWQWPEPRKWEELLSRNAS